MKILGYNIKDEYVWIGGGLIALWALSDGFKSFASQVCANGKCWEGDNLSVSCVNGVCTENEGGDGSSSSMTSGDGSAMTSNDPEVARQMIDDINRRIRRQQRKIFDEAEGNYARAYQGVGGGGMGGGAGGANGLGEINNDFMAQLQAMIQQAVADGMASGAGQDAVGESGANANGLPGLDANGAPGMGGHGGHGGMGGVGGAGGAGGHAHGGRGGNAMGGMGGGRKKRGMGGGGYGKGGAGAGKKKGMGGAGKAQGAAKGKTPPDCTLPENATLPDCATPSPTDTAGSDSGFAYAYAVGAPGGIGMPGQAGGIGMPGMGGSYDPDVSGRLRGRGRRSYQAEDMGYPEEGYGDDEDDFFRAYNTGNTFDLNMPTNPMSSAAYGNTRYDQMTPWKVVTA